VTARWKQGSPWRDRDAGRAVSACNVPAVEDVFRVMGRIALGGGTKEACLASGTVVG